MNSKNISGKTREKYFSESFRGNRRNSHKCSEAVRSLLNGSVGHQMHSLDLSTTALTTFHDLVVLPISLTEQMLSTYLVGRFWIFKCGKFGKVNINNGYQPSQVVN